MATVLEKYAYRQFRDALNAQYVEALANLAQDGEGSVNWIKRDFVDNAFETTWGSIAIYNGSKMYRKIMGQGANVIGDTWKNNALSYLKTSREKVTYEVFQESQKQYVKAIRKATEQAINEGIGVEATQRRIRKLVGKELAGKTNIYRARRIAQTEVVSAGNFASNLAMEQAHAEGAQIMKQWRVGYSGKDPRHGTYPGLDGQVRPIGQDFDVGGNPALFPGDSRLPAGEVINCQCASQSIEDFGIGFINMR